MFLNLNWRLKTVTRLTQIASLEVFIRCVLSDSLAVLSFKTLGAMPKICLATDLQANKRRTRNNENNLNPNRPLDHHVSRVIVFVLFPNIFYFIVGILPVFPTRCSPLRLHYKEIQSANNKTKSV